MNSPDTVRQLFRLPRRCISAESLSWEFAPCGGKGEISNNDAAFTTVFRNASHAGNVGSSSDLVELI